MKLKTENMETNETNMTLPSSLHTRAAQAMDKKNSRPKIDIAVLLSMIEQDSPLCRANYYRDQYPSEWRKAVRLDKINVWCDDAGTEYVELGAQK